MECEKIYANKYVQTTDTFLRWTEEFQIWILERSEKVHSRGHHAGRKPIQNSNEETVRWGPVVKQQEWGHQGSGKL